MTLRPVLAGTVVAGLLAGVVASAAGSGSMADLETYGLENSLNVRNLPATDKDLAERYIRALVATAYGGAPRSEVEDEWEKVRTRPWAFSPPAASDPY